MTETNENIEATETPVVEGITLGDVESTASEVAPVYVSRGPDAHGWVRGTGRRKSAVARVRIKAGSGEKMRKPGSKGAPSAKAFRESAKTAKKPKGK